MGTPPFAGPTPQILMARHALDAPPPIRTARSTVPEYLAEAIEKSLAKLPGDRFATAQEFAEAISGAGVGRRRRGGRAQLFS